MFVHAFIRSLELAFCLVLVACAALRCFVCLSAVVSGGLALGGCCQRGGVLRTGWRGVDPHCGV